MSIGTEFPNWKVSFILFFLLLLLANNNFVDSKLGEKKAIREAEPIFNTALASLREKLGSDWSFLIDWETIGKISEEKPSYRADPGKHIVTALVADMVKNDIAKFDDETVKALNKVCGGDAPGPKVDFSLTRSQNLK